MSTSITLLLDMRRPKKNGTFPLILRIIHNRTKAQILTGIYLLAKDWNEEKLLVKSSYKDTRNVTRLNNQLVQKKAALSDFISKLDETKELARLATAHEIKALFERKHERMSVFSYTDTLISEMERANQIGNARIYKSVKGIIKGYCGKDMSFQEMNYAFLKKFETDHYAKGNKTNSLSVYMRTLRAIFNKAIKDGIIEPELYPYKNYQIKSSKTDKRAISVTALKKIEDLVLEPSHRLAQTQDYFLFCFYLRGLPYTDMAHLKIENIVDGRIKFMRQKTDQSFNIKIIDKAQKILDKYTLGKQKADYIFPIINRTDPKEIYKDVEWSRNRYNKKLKEIATLCGISENATSYIARHSFATHAKNMHIPVTTISEMLGHESIKTTQIYLDSLPSDLMDDAHERIIQGISEQPVKPPRKIAIKTKE